MTATPGSASPMAAEPRVALVRAGEPRVVRFAATERHLHTAHATAFMVMLFTGFVLYVPFMAQIFSDRPLMKAAHLAAAAVWLAALAVVLVLGDRRALRRTLREIERFDDDDLLFLRGRAVPQGRFNAGQKVHAIVQAALAVLFTVSGVLLWLGERDTALRLPGTLALHDAAALLAGALVAGHVYLAITRWESLQGIWRGTVPESYAARHHGKWSAREHSGDGAPRPHGVARLGLAAGIAGIGLVAAALLVRDVLG